MLFPDIIAPFGYFSTVILFPRFIKLALIEFTGPWLVVIEQERQNIDALFYSFVIFELCDAPSGTNPRRKATSNTHRSQPLRRS